MKLILCAILFLLVWAIFKGGDCDPDWYDDPSAQQEINL